MRQPDWSQTAAEAPEEDYHDATSGREDGKEFPTEREAARAATKTPVTKAKAALKITGANSDFPTLGLTRSHDPVFNMGFVIHGRLVTHKWKQLVWQLRGRAALAVDQHRPWKRPVRWLAALHGTETSAMWGHLGVASRELKAPKGAGLYK